MKYQLKLDENVVSAAYLRTIYELIDELNCASATTLEEHFNKNYNSYVRTRIIDIYGDNTIVSWLKLRIQRYLHLVGEYGRLIGEV